MRVSTYRRLRTRSGKNFECLMSNTAFNQYVALFFASDQRLAQGVLSAGGATKRAVTPLKGVVSAIVSGFCGMD